MAAAPDFTDLTNLFHLLSDASRMRIMLLLAKGANNVTELGKALKLRQPLVSHHLGILRMSRLVVDQKTGREVVYTLAPHAKVAGGKLRISVPPFSVTLDVA